MGFSLVEDSRKGIRRVKVDVVEVQGDKRGKD